MYHFNLHNSTEMEVLRHLAFGDGIITKDQFLSISTKTMLSRYKSAGLIEQRKNAEKNIFQITNRFKSLYLKQIDPDHRFACSGSKSHSAVLFDAINVIPKTATITTGQTLKEEFQKFQKTTEYFTRTAEIQKNYQNKIMQLSATVSNTAASFLDRCNAMIELKQQTTFSKMESLCSTADLRISVTREEISQMLEELTNRHLNYDLTPKHERFLLHSINTLQHVQENMTTERVDILVEAITDTYGAVQIEQKFNISYVLDTPIIFITDMGGCFR